MMRGKGGRLRDHRRRPYLHFRASALVFWSFSQSLVQPTIAVHHLENPPIHLANRQNSDVPLRVTNKCAEVIYAAIFTQSGNGPVKSGFRLDTGESRPQNVSADWSGRVWGRTNCTFDGSQPTSGQGGSACLSGDCGQFIECQGVGNPPATLAEFTLGDKYGHSVYDVSLVDGYNLPMGIIFDPNNVGNLTEIPPNLTNPVCIGTASMLGTQDDTSDQTFGSNTSYPIPLEKRMTTQTVLNWCPWPLQLNPPEKPGDGVYPYPDDHIERPFFNPCLSACAKWNDEKYCCTGGHSSPDKCKPSYYSTQAKMVCPDAYSYAFDDQTSTFTLPQGGGFEVVFCPTGRSSNILKTFGGQLQQLAQQGFVSRDINTLAQNTSYIEEKSDGSKSELNPSIIALVVLLMWVCMA